MTTAKWRVVSGITVENERTLDGKERRAALRKLFAAADAEIRAEMQEAKEDLEFKEERTFLWEPLPAVCRRLEIPECVLTRHLKELTGMTATQLVDRIRAEGLKERIRAQLAECFKRRWWPGKAAMHQCRMEQRERFRQGLKLHRMERSFCLATMAIELGFANYARMYRACLLRYAKTPTQIEDEIVKEFDDYYRMAELLKNRREAAEAWTQHARELDKYRAPYADDWAKAMKERPEWVAKMREELGLWEGVAEVV